MCSAIALDSVWRAVCMQELCTFLTGLPQNATPAGEKWHSKILIFYVSSHGVKGHKNKMVLKYNVVKDMLERK